MPTTITPAGDLSCADLLTIQMHADEVWADGIQKREYEAKVDALKCLADNTSVKIEALEDGTKNYKVKLYWEAFCDDVLIDCPTDKCAVPTVPEASSGCSDYTLSCLKGGGFKVPVNKFKDSEFERQRFVAKNMLKVDKQLSEFIAKQFITSLSAEAGVNQFDPIIQGGAVDEIPATMWTPSLMGYFAQVADHNDYSNPWVLSGQNLYNSLWHARMNAGNANGTGDNAMATSLPICFDTRNVDGVNTPDKVTYLINRNALVWANRYCHTLNNPVTYHTNQGAFSEWAQESANIPGTYFDWTKTIICEGGDYYEYYYATVNGGFLLNPLGCDSNKTGILAFRCV